MGLFRHGTERKAQDLEGEIQVFVQREVVALQDGVPRHPEDGGTAEVEDNVISLLQRASANSIQQIDEMIDHLVKVRDRIKEEGERVQHSVLELARLGQATERSVRDILDRYRLPDTAGIEARQIPFSRH